LKMLPSQSSSDEPAHVYYDRVIFCARCGYPVENEMAKLDTRVYHVNCFTCDRCQSSLAGKAVHIEDGKKYDEECYQLVATKRCDICEQPITGDNEKYIKAKGKMYHTNCYVCSQCGTSLRKNRHTVEGKKRICQACVNANRVSGASGGNTFGAPRGGNAFGAVRSDNAFGAACSGEAIGAAANTNVDMSEEL